MKKKNKVGRLQGVESNSSNRDSIIDTPHKKQAAKKDAFQLFAEKVRDHKDFVSRWAALQEIQVEYFRGKDFVSFMRNHSELNDTLESDRSLEPEEIANILLKKKLLVRCDRVVKTVQPGKKKLSTFPAHLEIYDFLRLCFFTCGCSIKYFLITMPFRVDICQKKAPVANTSLILLAILTLAVCFFPVYPNHVKLLILYPCAGVLLLRLCLLLLRAMVFGALWILLGSRVWFFPNVLAEEATLKELFQFWPQKDEGKQPKWQARLFYEIVAVVVILLPRHHAPDEAATARFAGLHLYFNATLMIYEIQTKWETT